MTFDAILSRFTAAVEAGDGTALGALFTQDGIYHDTFYGEFHGPSAIKDMLENHFWRDAEAFRLFDERPDAGRWSDARARELGVDSDPGHGRAV